MQQIEDIKVQAEYYNSLPYTTVVEKMDDQGIYYVARVLELDGLMMTGETPEEAVTELESVRMEWIETHLEIGNKMPPPLELRKYSGQISLRIPPSLHRVLVDRAEIEGVSLNQYMTAALAQSAGREMDVNKPRTGKGASLVKK